MTAVRTGPESANTETVISGLIRAWNADRAIEFAGFFTENADLVNIHGMHLKGRQAIAGLYQMLFRSVFAQSSVNPSAASRKRLHVDVELVHVKVKFKAARGHMAGEQNAVISMVMTHHGDGWMVASMHNTLVSDSQN
uniref:DUF4440 domain-containing protein n=1 Tax=Solibacter usitatus (strain Ellin6076) TaxID=234267 RepID=Q01NX8_SOLUE